MEYLKNLFKNFIGPALFAFILILGWWAYNDIQIKDDALLQNQQAVEALMQERDELSAALGNQCKQLLERQGFVVGEFEPPIEK